MPARIRKQVYQLTPDDLTASPVWEFALDEESEPDHDEATVRPHPFSGTLDPSDGMFVIRARFTLADGSIMHGYLTPPTDGESLSSVQPQICVAEGQVGFWCGIMQPDATELQRRYSILGRTPATLFPVRYESEVQFVGGPIAGTVEGFGYFERDFTTVRSIK